jgi:uncharacterized protein
MRIIPICFSLHGNCVIVASSSILLYLKSQPDPNAIEAPEKSYLFVSASQLADAGSGLFTSIAIYRDEIIARFKGELLSARQAATRAANNKDLYFIEMPDGRILDSMKVSCFARYANDASGFAQPLHKNNSRIALDDTGQVCIMATRNIKAGGEIFCSYGKRYWEKHR